MQKNALFWPQKHAKPDTTRDAAMLMQEKPRINAGVTGPQAAPAKGLPQNWMRNPEKHGAKHRKQPFAEMNLCSTHAYHQRTTASAARC
ncbi:hypothetical protein QTU96_002764 [Enterobacter asburiae]|uniref:hypothetical protein n=1 Tax=Enterobacter roggenkampii TaxID=1812935 RepID=UPI0029321A85|nr:hypothetical protein [Enterobacter asburiae]